MSVLSKEQFNKIENFIISNGRKIDVAKWKYLFNGASNEEILKELLKYQNDDGGFGNGLNCFETWFEKTVSDGKGNK